MRDFESESIRRGLKNGQMCLEEKKSKDTHEGERSECSIPGLKR